MVKATPEQSDNVSKQTKEAFGEEDTRTAIFAGESSDAADLDALVLAKAKSNEGQDPRKIWRDTGWFKGKDDRWRFEVDDSKASMVDGQIVHSELEKAYPGVFDEIDISVEPLKKGLLGSFNPSNGELKISSELKPEEQLDTAIHELQHVIQEKEGFSPGGNPLSMEVFQPFDSKSQAKKTFVNDYLLERSDLFKVPAEKLINLIEERTGFSFSDYEKQEAIEKQRPSSAFSYFLYRASPEQRETLTGVELSEEANKRLEGLKNYEKPKEFFFEVLKNEYPEDLSQFKSADDLFDYEPENISSLEAFDKYKRTLGEAEARAATARKDFQPDQRRNVYPEDTYSTPEVGVSYEDTWTKPDIKFPSLLKEGFAKGGAVEEMKQMYQEGGLQDDGTEVEPVTGNEVPPGSMDQEVRDDISAQLSEGEYVLPADVVRFIGLGQIEQMVQTAKKGLMEMDANGRIGGEPVDSNGVPTEQDEELTAEEMQMLEEALGQSNSAPTGMYQGGMIPQQQRAAYNPYQQQQIQYSAPQSRPMFQSTRPVGMAQGGDVKPKNPKTNKNKKRSGLGSK